MDNSVTKNYTVKVSQKTNSIINIVKKSIEASSSSVSIYKNNTKILDIQNKKDDKLIETLSVTKSFCGLAVMFLIQDNLIKSENDLVSKYIESWYYGKKNDITIKHILTHTSGLDTYWDYGKFMWPKGKYSNFEKKIGKTPNVEEISLTIDKINENDKNWHYNDTATQVIPTLVNKLTGMKINKYLNIKLFEPLNIKYKWNKDDYNNDYGPNGLIISSDGLCKVGLLILNNGSWNNKILLKPELIKKMTMQRINQKAMRQCPMFANTNFSGYGYLWYNYKDLIIAEGFLGQCLIINKKKNIVASRLIQSRWGNKKFETNFNNGSIFFNEFISLIENM